MMRYVLDASAIIALLLDEPGAAEVRAVLTQSCICAVNLAEVVAFFAKGGASRAKIEEMLKDLPSLIIPADAELSFANGMLRPLTVSTGLSLGDRYCLALAQREGATALTADRPWAKAGVTTGIPVRLIR